VDDALAAVTAGADALGFMFYERSPRRVSFAQAAEMIRALPPFVSKVGVFVDASEAWIRQAILECGLDTLQLHGSETPAFCRSFAQKTIKAFRVRDAGIVTEVTRYDTSAWLLDSYVPGAEGGTGQTFAWDLAVKASQQGRPIILAGGLTPDNVAAAVRQVRPFGVDVSSGVESAPGPEGSSFDARLYWGRKVRKPGCIALAKQQ